jgi:alpha-aminoadipic semialdehyde synthase
MLKTLVENRATLIDYELIRDDKDNRLITAFTYNAGYAGMVDTLWTLGKRLKLSGISNPFEAIPQAVEGQDLLRVKNILKKVGHKIEVDGTPADLPPIIICFLGKGKTAHGAREIFDILPHENITLKELEKTFKQGSRKKAYALQLRTDEIYRLRKKYESESGHYEKLILSEKRRFYKDNPEYFRSNLDKVLAYVTVLMNCVVWSPEYPRSVTKELMKNIYSQHKTLVAIGDITCDPNGSIEFSKETWIDDPVYIYNPHTGEINNGFDGDGIAVMAVTNLPCEFSTDASSQFSEDIYPLLKSIVSANYVGRMRDSNLPDEIKRAVILWKGKFAPDFEYMKGFIEREN